MEFCIELLKKNIFIECYIQMIKYLVILRIKESRQRNESTQATLVFLEINLQILLVILHRRIKKSPQRK